MSEGRVGVGIRGVQVLVLHGASSEKSITCFLHVYLYKAQMRAEDVEFRVETTCFLSSQKKKTTEHFPSYSLFSHQVLQNE